MGDQNLFDIEKKKRSNSIHETKEIKENALRNKYDMNLPEAPSRLSIPKAPKLKEPLKVKRKTGKALQEALKSVTRVVKDVEKPSAVPAGAQAEKAVKAVKNGKPQNAVPRKSGNARPAKSGKP